MSRAAAFPLFCLLLLLPPAAGFGGPVPAERRPAPSGAMAPLHRETGLFLLGGRPVGYYRQITTPDGESGFRTEIYELLQVARAGTPFTIIRRETWLEAETLRRLEAEIDMNGQPQRLQARSVAAGIETTLQIGGSVERRVLPAEGPVLGVYRAGRRLLDAIGRGERALDYRVFLSDEARVDRMEVRLLGEGTMTDSAGRVYRGVLAEEHADAYPDFVTRSVVDPQEGIRYSRISMGFPVEMVRVERSLQELEALLAADSSGRAPALDMVTLGIPVDEAPAWKDGGAGVRSAVLQFSGEGTRLLEGRLLEAARDLGAPGEGAIGVRRRGELLEVRLRAPRRPESAPAGVPVPAAASAWTGGGFYLDLDDPRLGSLLAGAWKDGRLDPAALSDRVFRAIWKKSTRFGFAGTREVLDSREGDCTEHAVLLISLLRRAGFPARMAYGFVLDGGAFIGHAWTEAFLDGRWQWLDPSFPGEESRRLKLRLGVLDPAEPITGRMSADLLQAAGSVRVKVLEWRGE